MLLTYVLSFPFFFFSEFYEQGTGAPIDAEPCSLKKKSKKRKPNASQLQPHTSRELEKNDVIFQSLKMGFEDVFEWVRDTVRRQVIYFVSFLTTGLQGL